MKEEVMKENDQEKLFSIECDAMSMTEQPKSLKYRFVWVIEKFSELTQANGYSIESCDLIFKGPCDIERKWKLKVYPNGISSNYNGKVSVDLISMTKCSVNASYKIATLDKTKTITNNNIKGQYVFYEESEASYDNAALYSFAVKSLLEEQLQPDDTLIIVCDITEEPARRTVSMTDRMLVKNGNPMMLFNSVYHKELVKDMSNIFMKKENGHDVLINCGDKVFYCHKFMLSARSQVFHAMFNSDMVENKSCSVNVEDFHPNVMEEMLQYIYTGCTLAIDKYGRELLAVAEKYQLEKLKTCCEEYLSGTLDVENCIDLLLLGDLNQAKTLKETALEFFSKNLSSFKEGDWKKRLNDYPILAIEVMECLFSKKI